MGMKKCVVSFADGAGVYRQKMERLAASVRKFSDADFLGFTSYEEIGCEPHSVIPYKFKPCAIQTAVEMGYELIIWADSPVHAIKDLRPAFDYLEEYGYFFFDNIGHPLGKWTNDKCLVWFDTSRSKAMDMQMIMACCMGFKVDVMRYILQDYSELADALYPGSWDDHRHDQTVMSFLIHENGLNILRGQDTFFAYKSHYGVLPIAESVCLISE